MPQDTVGIHSAWYQQAATSDWYALMDHIEQNMALQSLDLLNREEKMNSAFHDYAFVVFPMAKAYEGFLKKYLLQKGLITEQTYFSRKFRIGRSLNPDIPFRQRDEEWVYDNVVLQCGQDAAKLLWKAWIEGRNLLFHSFPDHRHLLGMNQARERILLIVTAMDALMKCS